MVYLGTLAAAVRQKTAKHGIGGYTVAHRIAGLAAALLFLSACDAGFSGSPRDSLRGERDFNALVIDATLKPERIAALAAAPFVDLNTRNAIIEARIAEIDILYFEFEKNISAEVRRGKFATNLAGILIGAAGGQATGASAARYAAAGGIVTGASAAYQKEILLDQSIQAYVSQMRANRNRKKTDILKKMTRSGTTYTLQAALSDLAEYQQAGTLASAISGLTEKAQKDEETSTGVLISATTSSLDQRARVVTRPAPTSVAVGKINDYLTGGGSPDANQTRFQQAAACLQSVNVENKPASMLDYLQTADANTATGNAIVACLNATHGAEL